MRMKAIYHARQLLNFQMNLKENMPLEMKYHLNELINLTNPNVCTNMVVEFMSFWSNYLNKQPMGDIGKLVVGRYVRIYKLTDNLRRLYRLEQTNEVFRNKVTL